MSQGLVTHQKFDCESCFFKLISCNYLSSDEFELIRRTSIQLTFKKGETILKQGARATHLVFLHKGIVKFVYENEFGKNCILTIMSGPGLLGGANMFYGETNFCSISSIEDCEICLIDIKALMKTLSTNPKYAMFLFEKAAGLFRSAVFNFISLAYKQVNGRIADILIYLTESVYFSRSFTLSVTRKEISEFAGCSQENVITTLSRLHKEGVIEVDHKNITIKDFEKLTQISRFG